MSEFNLPGSIKHAPSVMCFVAVPLDWPAQSRNNGKVVVIHQRYHVGSLYHCQCGSNGILYVDPAYRDLAPIIWEVMGREIYCNAQRVTKRLFPQSWLIPIADGESFKRLYESEASQKELSKIAEWISQVESTNS